CKTRWQSREEPLCVIRWRSWKRWVPPSGPVNCRWGVRVSEADLDAETSAARDEREGRGHLPDITAAQPTRRRSGPLLARRRRLRALAGVVARPAELAPAHAGPLDGGVRAEQGLRQHDVEGEAAEEEDAEGLLGVA